MAQPQGDYPNLQGVNFEPVEVIAAAAQGSGNSIPGGTKTVEVTGVVNDADDFIVLPSLAEVQNGHEITILCSAGGNFE